jgi:transposase
VEEARTYVHAHRDETRGRQGDKRVTLGSDDELGDRVLDAVIARGDVVPRVREGTLKYATFRSSMIPVRQEGQRLLEKGSRCAMPTTILKRREALWPCVQVVGVEPTNNAAERSIRPGVLWCKGSFGTQSEAGSRFVESRLTVVSTLQQQQRNLLAYRTTACEAVLHGAAAPSLLPASDQKARTAA